MLTAYDGRTITYDTVGNPLSDGVRQYTWEHGRELATITKDGATWTNTYNQDGMRIRRTNGTVTYGYVYNGSQLSQMTVGSNTLNFSYDANGIPMSVSYNGTTYYYATNLQGDVTAILNASGSPVVSYTYDAWGKPLTVTGSLATTLGTHNPLRYRGYVYDTETELYYLQSRYYNPDTGRFLNADAFTSTGQGFTGNNMFAYCGNNPVARKDDGGDFWLNVLIGAAVGAVAGVVGQFVSDVATSLLNGEVTISNWQTYTGAAVGGAAGGVVLATTGNMNAANAVTGAVTTGVGQSLEKLTISNYDKSWAEIGANAVIDGAISYGLGKLPGVKKVTSGQHSWSAVYKSGLTRLRHGTAARMSAKVIGKGIGSSIVGGGFLDAYYGVKQYAYDRIKRVLLA